MALTPELIREFESLEPGDRLRLETCFGEDEVTVDRIEAEDFIKGPDRRRQLARRLDVTVLFDLGELAGILRAIGVQAEEAESRDDLDYEIEVVSTDGRSEEELNDVREMELSVPRAVNMVMDPEFWPGIKLRSVEKTIVLGGAVESVEKISEGKDK